MSCRLVIGLLLLAGCACWAGDDHELTVHTGLRFGGEADAGTIGVDSLDVRPAFGLTYDRALGANSELWAAWSFQRAEVNRPALDVDLHYLHVGSSYHPKVGDRARAFVNFGLGLTWIDPRAPEFDDGIGASLLIGGGFRIPWKPKIAWRFDFRGYATLVETEIEGTCGGVGCSIDFSGSGGFQVDVLGGLAFTF